MLENRVEHGRGGVGHGVEARKIRPQHRRYQLRPFEQGFVLFGGCHDVVDEGGLLGIDTAGVVAVDHSLAELEDALLGAAVVGHPQHDARTHVNHEHVERIAEENSQIVDILARRAPGHHDAQLLGGEALHGRNHAQPLPRLPLVLQHPIGNVDELVVASADGCAAVAALHHLAEPVVHFAVGIDQALFGSEFVDELLPEFLGA
jgi:hypothetical protein